MRPKKQNAGQFLRNFTLSLAVSWLMENLPATSVRHASHATLWLRPWPVGFGVAGAEND